jgi:hypothetical protein
MYLIFTFVISMLPFWLAGQSQVTIFALQKNKGVFELSNGKEITSAAVDNAIFHPGGSSVFFIRRVTETYQVVRMSDEAVGDTVLMVSKYSLSSLQNCPDKKSISLIRTNENGSRDLVVLSVGGGAIQTKAEQIDFTHYAWVDDNSLVVRVPGTPNTLRLRSIRPRKETLIAQNVGEALHRFMDIPSVTFIHQQSFDFSTFKRISEKDGRIEVVVDAAAEQTVFTWTPDQVLLSQLEDQIISFDPKKDKDWKPVKTDDTFRTRTIKFMEVNPAGNKILLIH